jgi:hypothetical protein
VVPAYRFLSYPTFPARSYGLTATAVHHHLVGEEPKIYFVHFWGDAPLTDLLRALRAALDATKLP